MDDRPRLPGFVPDAVRSASTSLRGGSGRASAGRINEVEPRKRTLTISARNTLLPIAYGRVELPGLVFAIGYISSDLVIGYLWCVGEIDAVEDVYVNDEELPAGVTATHYTGTPTQGVDPTLDSAITAYADTLRFDTPTGKRGAAYTVLRIPPDEIDGWPRARAIVRGRKVYDPRTSTTAYSDNSALCLGDLITDPDYGLGMPTPDGLADCADWCDSLLGGVSARARIAIGIQRGRRIYPDLLDLLSEYAECWYTLDGPGIRLIPDQPVDLGTVPTIGPSGIIQNSLTLTSEDTTDAPTEVEVRYTDPTESAEPWQTDTVAQSLEGVGTGERPRIPTSVRLEAIFRFEEAQNKAVQRLARQRNRVSVVWQTTDAGVVWQKGDVVQIDHPARGVDMPVRITGVRLVAPGRYEVSAHRYSADQYSDELIAPEGSGVVPQGAITLLAGSQVPDGWAEWTKADGRYIVGAGGAYSIGQTGGSTAYTIPAGSTTEGGGHTPPTVGIAATFDFDQYYWERSPFADPVGSHSHAVSEISSNYEPTRRENILVQKIDGDGIVLPAAVRVLGLSGLDLDHITDLADRFLKAASQNDNREATGGFTGTTDSSSDTHTHWSARGESGTSATSVFFYDGQGGGSHSHSIAFSVSEQIKRQDLPLYGAAGNYDILPGTIFMWEGDIGSLPDDYLLCDGANGTPDMRDFFLRLAGTSPSTRTASSALSVAGSTNTVSHTHSRTIVGAGSASVSSHSGGSHSHVYNPGLVAYEPPYYALAFIMYAPAS